MHFVLIVSLCIFLTGCAPLVITGIGGATAYQATRRKSISKSISVTNLACAVTTQIAKGGATYENVSVDVEQGYVLLSGMVATQEQKLLVEDEVWKVNGVVGIKNQISVGKNTTFLQKTNDSAITASIKSSLLLKPGVRSSNFNIKTINGVVHVRGIAASEAEKQAVITTIQKTKGVRKIVSYITLG